MKFKKDEYMWRGGTKQGFWTWQRNFYHVKNIISSYQGQDITFAYEDNSPNTSRTGRIKNIGESSQKEKR
jgi:hypothetical protein